MIDCRRWAPDLVRRQVAVIATLGGNAASLAAKPVTTTTPVVFYGSADPVESGLVASLKRPVGNVTGVVTLNIDTGQKRLELGSTTARSGDEVALIRDTINHYWPVFIAPLSIQIRRAGVQKKWHWRMVMALEGHQRSHPLVTTVTS